MSNITKLPTAATSYYTVRKDGRFFDIVLVTPSPGMKLRTRLYRFTDRTFAIEQGKAIAAKAQRPFKLRGVAV